MSAIPLLSRPNNRFNGRGAGVCHFHLIFIYLSHRASSTLLDLTSQKQFFSSLILLQKSLVTHSWTCKQRPIRFTSGIRSDLLAHLQKIVFSREQLPALRPTVSEKDVKIGDLSPCQDISHISTHSAEPQLLHCSPPPHNSILPPPLCQTHSLLLIICFARLLFFPIFQSSFSPNTYFSFFLASMCSLSTPAFSSLSVFCLMASNLLPPLWSLTSFSISPLFCPLRAWLDSCLTVTLSPPLKTIWNERMFRNVH